MERSPFTTAASPRTLSAILIIIALGVAGYVLRGEIVDVFSPPPPPDVDAINTAVDSAFVEIDAREVSAATVAIDGSQVLRDRLVLPEGTSALRANLAITRAVERAGGTIVYGVESTDRKRRWQTVTLGVSTGDSLIREIILVSRVR